ncbi:MAG: ABC transporter ATP-binding protein [candidate division Zixibacteria bacterium]|nr:ABC transporter ATP-binding protein [candidate division Zixibacteria bacterium]MCI0597007.1 ABC transporter ATP-binding protein [candidate division Zixibacteria bacterium]
MGATLSAAGLAKFYGDLKVFSKLDFSVTAGEVLVVAGPNGSGKSTLLKIAAGLLAPSSGRLEFRDATEVIPKENRRQFLYMVSPDLSFYEELTARENLHFFLSLLGRKTEKVTETLAKVGLETREEDDVADFSLGMRQRLKYALAFLLEPKFLLLDEPSANLDESGIKIVVELLNGQKKRGLALVATNDPNEYVWGDKKLELGG